MPSWGRCRGERKELIRGRLRQVLRKARKGGLGPDGLEEWSIEQRLEWQQWRAGRGLYLLTATLSLLALAWIWLLFPAYPSQLVPLFPFFLIALCVIPPAVFGALAFQGDRRQHPFRFLAYRGVRPTPLWLSKQAIPAVLTLGWALLYTVTTWAMITQEPPNLASRQLPPLPQTIPFLAAPVALLTFTAYAAGQFCSQCVRNGLLSCLLGVILAGVLCTWVLTMLASPVVVSWAVWAMPVILLALTCTWMPSWLEERRPWRHHAFSAAALLIPGLLFTSGIAAHRVLEFPPVDPVLLADDRAPPPDALTAATAMSLYQRASDILSQFYHSAWQTHVEEHGLQPHEPGSRDEVRQRHREAARLVEEAGNMLQGAPVTSDPGTTGPLLQWHKSHARIALGKNLVNAAAGARSGGDLDLALHRCLAALRWSVSLAHPDADRHLRGSGMYIYRDALLELCRWAAEPTQTPALLDEATRTVEDLLAPIPSPHRNAAQAYRTLLNALDVPPENVLSDWGRYPNFFADAAMRLIPWEMARLRRNVAKAAEGELVFWQLLENRVGSSPTGHWDDIQALTDISQSLPLHRHDPVQAWLHDTWINTTTYQRAQGLGMNRRWYDVEAEATGVLNAITLRRAWRLAMTIHQWRTEHGRFPESLEELGPDFVVPVSARHGQPIVYVRQGPSPIREGEQWRLRRGTGPDRLEIRATPYLHSTDLPEISLSPGPVWIRVRTSR